MTEGVILSMRIRIRGRVIDAPQTKEKIPTHSLQALLLNRLGDDALKKAHAIEKTPNLYTFSPLKINRVNQTFSLVFSSTIETVEMLKASFKAYNLFQIDKLVLQVETIQTLTELPIREHYLFTGCVLASDKQRRVYTEAKDIEKTLVYNAESKLKALGYEDADLTIELIQHKKALTLYEKEKIDRKGNRIKKAVNIPSHYVVVAVAGDQEAIEALYAVGFGQNTGTGNGLLWEVSA